MGWKKSHEPMFSQRKLLNCWRNCDFSNFPVEVCGNSAGIVHAEHRVWDTKKRLLASIERARETLGYEPGMDFDEGLHLTVQWFRDHWDAIDRDAEFPPGMSAAARGVVVRPDLSPSEVATTVA